MSVNYSTDWKFNDMQTVILENEMLRVVIIPELGAKIWELHYKPRAKQLLWQNSRLKPRRLPFHSVYDDTFFGGWDELYPNDMPEMIRGEAEPDHGEIWTLPWSYAFEHTTDDEITLHLWVETPISPSRIEKWITIKSGEAKLRFRHKITNIGQNEQPFIWKLHAAMAIDESSRIDLGAKTMYLEDFGPPRGDQTAISYTWPFLTDEQGQTYDMRRTLPITAQKNEFQYATEMKEGWCALTHTKERIGFGLAFDLKVLPSCWLFASYGGWRNLHTIVLEPCSGYPISLNEGIKKGTHQTLKPGQSFDCTVVAIVYEGLTEVTSIDPDGKVTGNAYAYAEDEKQQG